jgi:hypothetical protein
VLYKISAITKAKNALFVELFLSLKKIRKPSIVMAVRTIPNTKKLILKIKFIKILFFWKK